VGFRAQNSTIDSFRRCKISARFSARIPQILNRPLGFRIRAHSAIVRFETECSAGFFLLFSEVRLLFVNYLQNGFSCVASINCAEISRNHFPGDLYSERVQRFKAQNRLVGRFKKRWFLARKPCENRTSPTDRRSGLIVPIFWGTS
jgi:hypothetical protein